MRPHRKFVRPVLLLLLAIPVTWTEARAQKRMFAKVEPNANTVTSSAETYDPAGGGFTRVGSSMSAGREGHAAVMMRNGKVLLVGGYNGAYLSTADIYNAASGTLTASAGSLSTARNLHAATLLQDGRVLITGGYNGSSYLSSAELYNPSTDAFTSVSSSLTAGRRAHTATLLPSGKVLLAGGYNGSYLSSAELYDPSAGTFTATGSMTAARAGHSATLLESGKVLIAGGDNGSYLSSAEIFDPGTGTFAATSGAMTDARAGHAATLLQGGRVLLSGGYNGSYLKGAEIYNPSANRFAAAGSMTVPRSGHAAALLTGGKVLVAGGYNGAYLNTAELYDPSAGTFSAVASPMTIARQSHAATLLPSGRVLITGGQNAPLLVFDINLDQTDNVAPNVVFSADSGTGFLAFTGSGVVLAFSPETGAVLKLIETGGKPAFATPLADGKTLAVVSMWENRIFLIDMPSLSVKGAYTFSNSVFGFGSILTLSPDGGAGYISSTGTAEVIKFNASTGAESGRLKGLQAPAQITVSKDGGTIIVVDTAAEELVFADASSMARKATFKPREKVATADLTIFNKAVLAPDGGTGIIACRDTSGSLYSGTAFIFRTSSGEILDTETVGAQPGYTALTPNGQNWVILNESTISLVPSYDPGARQEIATAQGDPLGSANIAISSDSRYAYYTSATHDLVFQHDLLTQGVVGQVSVNNTSNKGLEQASTVALTPDEKVLAAVSYIGNSIALIRDVTALNGARFLVSSGQFSGLSLVNLSGKSTSLTVSLLDNYGALVTQDELVNPLELTLGPNAQVSANVSQLFNLDPSTDHAGWLSVVSDQPQIVGYLSSGRIEATWFGYYLSRMDGAPLLRQQVHDWVIPEIVTGSGGSAQFDLVNANYSQELYDLRHYAKDGTLSGEKLGNVAYPTNRLEQSFSDLFTVSGADKVLVAGGQTSSATLSSADVYDVAGKTFAATGTMTSPRWGHTATLLLNGKVLLGGGKNGTTVLDSAETYNIATGTSTATADVMRAARHRHSATLLPSGKVLLAGGQNATSVNDTAEVYDPTSNNFTATAGNMTAPRDSHTATLLPTGKVLIAGGINGDAVTATAELYDPATGKFTAAEPMKAARVFHTATRLSNGRVLLAGGFDGSYLNSAEIYDPATGTFRLTAGSMTSRRDGHTATLLDDGRVLLAGGTDGNGALNSAEFYDPSTDSFSLVAGTMTAARNGHTAVLQSGTQVLILGGTNATDGALKSAEIFDADTQSFTAVSASMTAARNGHTATLLEPSGEGYVRVDCQEGLVFTEFYGMKRDGAMMNGIDVQKYRDVTRLYSPQFAIMTGFRTSLNLINANPDNDAQVTVTLHGPDGRVLGTPATLQIMHNGKVQDDLHNIFLLDPAVQDTTGWIEISSSSDRVLGTVSFTNEDDVFLTSFELSGAPLRSFVYPLAAEDSMYQTGIALLNAGTVAANVTLELWSPEGTVLRTAQSSLAPGTRTALYLSDYFPGMEPYVVGNIRVRSDQPVHSIGLINDRAFHFIAAVPPIATP